MCEHCLNEQTTICDCCNERVWIENTERDSYIDYLKLKRLYVNEIHTETEGI